MRKIFSVVLWRVLPVKWNGTHFGFRSLFRQWAYQENAFSWIRKRWIIVDELGKGTVLGWMWPEEPSGLQSLWVFILARCRVAEKQPFAGTQPLDRATYWPADCWLDFSLYFPSWLGAFGECINYATISLLLGVTTSFLAKGQF